MPKRNPKPKDPNMPKRPLSSYFLFSNERRAVLQQKMPDKKLTELSKLISVEWKELSDEQKEKYASKAKKAKDKYDKNLAAYKKTEDYAKYQQKLEYWKQSEKEAAKMDESGAPVKKVSLPRKPKDANCPKRSASSYFLFGNSVRARIKAENPDLKVTEIAKLIGEEWRKLSEEEKKPFNDEAIKLKAKYLEAMEKYRGSKEEAAFKKKLSEWEEECQRRRDKAAASFAKKKEKERSTKTKGKKAGKGRKKKVEESDESSSEESSGSESDSESSSGDSDMSSDGSSGSESESES